MSYQVLWGMGVLRFRPADAEKEESIADERSGCRAPEVCQASNLTRSRNQPHYGEKRISDNLRSWFLQIEERESINTSGSLPQR